MCSIKWSLNRPYDATLGCRFWFRTCIRRMGSFLFWQLGFCGPPTCIYRACMQCEQGGCPIAIGSGDWKQILISTTLATSHLLTSVRGFCHSQALLLKYLVCFNFVAGITRPNNAYHLATNPNRATSPSPEYNIKQHVGPKSNFSTQVRVPESQI